MGKRGEGGRGRRVGIRRKPGEVGGDGEKLKKFNVKGIVHQFFFFCSNLIFWIVMGCGIADFGRRGL